jgi:hypothetical protein
MSKQLSQNALEQVAKDNVLLDAMRTWWDYEIIAPLADMETKGKVLFSPEEEEIVEVLVAPLVSSLAAAALVGTHGLYQRGNAELRLKMSRAVILYAYLIGKGVLKPADFPVTTDELYRRQRREEALRLLMLQQGNGKVQ